MYQEAIKCLSVRAETLEQEITFYRDGKNNARVQLTDDYRENKTRELSEKLADVQSAIKKLLGA